MHIEECNQCGRCLEIAPAGSLKIDPVNFHTFQEACAISTSITYATFAPEKITDLSLATHQTPVAIALGSPACYPPGCRNFRIDDIVAIEKATLDMIAKTRLIEENIPTSMEVHTREGHPYGSLHGPHKDPYKVVEFAAALGMGEIAYELVDVLPVEEFTRRTATYIPAV